MDKKYHYRVFIYSDAWNLLRCEEIFSSINLHGILREWLFLYTDDFTISDEHIGAVTETRHRYPDFPDIN